MKHPGIVGFVLPHSASVHLLFTFQLPELVGIPADIKIRPLMKETKS